MRRSWRAPVWRSTAVGAMAAATLLAGCGADGSTPGESAYRSNGCAACHGTNRAGTTLGPSLRLAEGGVVQLEGGGQTVYDADYVRRAIVDPSAELTAGWQDTMTKVSLSDETIDEIVTYLLTP